MKRTWEGSATAYCSRSPSAPAAAAQRGPQRHGDGGYQFVLGRSKTNPTALRRPQDAKPIEGLAAEALSRWLTASGIVTGALWRRPGALALRAGFVTEAPIPKIMDKTGHTTSKSIRDYHRP